MQQYSVLDFFTLEMSFIFLNLFPNSFFFFRVDFKISVRLSVKFLSSFNINLLKFFAQVMISSSYLVFMNVCLSVNQEAQHRKD